MSENDSMQRFLNQQAAMDRAAQDRARERERIDRLEREHGPELDALSDDALALLADACLPGGRRGFPFQIFCRRRKNDRVARPLLLAKLSRERARDPPAERKPTAGRIESPRPA